MSRQERASILKVVVSCGVPYSTMREYLTGERRPAEWIRRQIESELGKDWQVKYAKRQNPQPEPPTMWYPTERAVHVGTTPGNRP